MHNFFDWEYDKIQINIELPDPILEEHDGFTVVRDDLLPGGTKRRAFLPYISSKPDIEEWVYASPRFGYAQLALAYICKDLDKKATVIVPKGKRSWLTDKSEALGANVIEVPMGFLTHCNSVAEKYTTTHKKCSLLPFGGDHPIIVEAIHRVASKLPINPTEIWTVISSGVLSRGLQKTWPHAKFYGVKIGHNTTQREQGKAIIHNSQYSFAQECKIAERPPFPSSLTYDSKAWTFIKKFGAKGALFWNVGA